jgi:peptidoglycan/LPS O-acetylase OafA/YrhL
VDRGAGPSTSHQSRRSIGTRNRADCGALTMLGKNARLEMLRALAALTVLAGHYYMKPAQMPHLAILEYALNWGTEAVMVFFLLSGAVIRLSQERRMPRAYEYVCNRVVRIVPIYLVSIALAFVAEFATGSLESLPVWMGNLFFLQSIQGWIVGPPSTDPALWSLSSEMLFYMLLGVVMATHPHAMKVWVMVSVVSLVSFPYDLGSPVANHLRMQLAYSSIWLLGYFATAHRDRLRIDKGSALAIVPLALAASRTRFLDDYYEPYRFVLMALLFVPLFGALTSESRRRQILPLWLLLGLAGSIVILLWTHSSSNTVTQIVLTVASFAGVLLRPAIPRLAKIVYRFRTPLLWVASLSYALYVVHLPILYLIQSTKWSVYVVVPTSLVASFAAAYVLEVRLQPVVARHLRVVLNRFQFEPAWSGSADVPAPSTLAKGAPAV